MMPNSPDVRIVGLALAVTLSLAGCGPAPLLTAPVTQVAAAAESPPSQALPTPTPAPDDANAAPAPGANLTLLIDAAGRDFAERRIIQAYERVAPSVVSITTQSLRRDLFYNVVPEEGAGSGFVLDDEGHILTNYHVIEGAESIEVAFGEQLTAQATVIGTDPRNDLAVLQVDLPAALLQPVELGASDNLRVGQWAIAIGNPFGQFGRTLTSGVISALGRSLAGPDGRTITGVIQTDAAINRGNSGGPLLDSSGRVIGITTAIFSPTGASAGVGFAVPVGTIRRVLPDLLMLGRYRHPWLGVRYAYNLTPGLAEVLKLPMDSGLLLVQLYGSAPLATAGARGAQSEVVIGNQRVLVGGDILTALDGRPVRTLDQLEMIVEDSYKVGDIARVTLLRDGQPFDVNVELTEEPG